MGVQPLFPACLWRWGRGGDRPWHPVSHSPGAVTVLPQLSLREQLHQAQCLPTDPCLPTGAADELRQLQPPGDVELGLSAG